MSIKCNTITQYTDKSVILNVYCQTFLLIVIYVKYRVDHFYLLFETLLQKLSDKLSKNGFPDKFKTIFYIPFYIEKHFLHITSYESLTLKQISTVLVLQQFCQLYLLKLQIWFYVIYSFRYRSIIQLFVCLFISSILSIYSFCIY